VLHDILVRGGEIRSVAPTGRPHDRLPVPVVDVAGRAVIPALVDAHVHLDKAYQLAYLNRLPAAGGGVADAIAVTRALRATMSPQDVRGGMRRVLDRMAATGTVAARAHVEIDAGTDPATVGEHRDIAAAYPHLYLQLVAFPQRGTSRDREVERRMERALDDGCTVVGGCPYADPDPVRHLDFVIGLAVDRGLPLDLHLDLTDDPGRSQADLVLDRIERAGLQGRVTLGHMTALASMTEGQRDRLIRRLAALDVAVVSLPVTDLWLSGRDSHPPVRGLAPIRSLLSAGVRVALGTNNHQNAFTPVGGGGLLRAAWLASLVAHIGDIAGYQALLNAVSQTPAELLGLGPWGIRPGSRAPLLVIDADDPLDAVREAPNVARVTGPRSLSPAPRRPSAAGIRACALPRRTGRLQPAACRSRPRWAATSWWTPARARACRGRRRTRRSARGRARSPGAGQTG
jgi:cytosine deaminase